MQRVSASLVRQKWATALCSLPRNRPFKDDGFDLGISSLKLKQSQAPQSKLLAGSGLVMTYKRRKLLDLLSRQISRLTGYMAQLLVLVNKAHPHPSSLPYVVANILNHKQADFGHMPIDAVTPDEALCPAVCCPNAQCRHIVCGMY